MSFFHKKNPSAGEALGVILLCLLIAWVMFVLCYVVLASLWLVWPPIPVAVVLYFLDKWLFDPKKK